MVCVPLVEILQKIVTTGGVWEVPLLKPPGDNAFRSKRRVVVVVLECRHPGITHACFEGGMSGR